MDNKEFDIMKKLEFVNYFNCLWLSMALISALSFYNCVTLFIGNIKLKFISKQKVTLHQLIWSNKC